jgi:CrcB protein
MSLSIWLAVGVGGALGAMARHGVSRAALHYLGPNFPWGTLAANAVGSFIMGVVVVWLARHEPQSPTLRAFLAVGMLGAVTTFSPFALDAVTLYKDRTLTIAAAYVASSVTLSIGGLVAGMAVMRASA